MKNNIKTYFFGLIILLLLTSSVSILSAQSSFIQPIRLNDIVYNPNTDRIYAAAPGQLRDGNAIHIIHPNTGLVEQRIPINSEPIILRFSDNYQYLYIGYNGLNELHRYDLLNDKLEIIAVLETALKPLYINDILPVPKHPEKVIVTLQNRARTPESFGIVVFDGFNRLTRMVTRTDEDTRNLVADSQTGRLFGFGHAYRSTDLIEYEVTEEGIRAKEIYEDLLWAERSEIEIYNGKLYTQIGQVVDLTKSPPVQITSTTADKVVQNLFDSDVLEIDPSNGLIYNIHYDRFSFASDGEGENGFHFRTIDPTDYHLINRKRLNGFIFKPDKLIYTGVPGRFAAISAYTQASAERTAGHFTIIGACTEEISPERLIISRDKEEYCWLDIPSLTVSDNYENYHWSTGDSEKTIELEINQPTKVSVAVIDEKGCTIAQSDTIELKIIFPPNNGYWIEGAPLKCPEDSILLTANISFLEDESTDGYLWSTGETTKSIIVKEPGLYYVHRVRESTCAKQQPTYFTVMNYPDRKIPKAKIIDLGDTVFCANEPLKARAADKQDRYVWDGRADPGREVSINARGFRTLQYIDENGCLGEADTIQVKRLPVPPKPEIKGWFNRFYYHSSYKNKWFYNGEPLPLADSDTLYALKKGFYNLALVDENGCMSDLSEMKTVTTPYIAEGQEGIISGRVWIDANKNGRLDSLDTPFSSARINLDIDNQITFTNQQGFFTYRITKQAYKVQTMLDPTLWKTVIGENGFKDDFSTVVTPYYDFLIQPVSAEPRLLADVNTGIVRCNQKMPVWTSIRNVGNESFTGNLCLSVNPKIVSGNFQGDSVSISNGHFCWNIDSLALGNVQKTNLSLDLPGAASIGETYQFDLSVEYENEKIAIDFYEDIFRCAYDPNDKQVAPRRGVNGQYALFDDELEYIIRFQNTGNDTAFTVLLKDELSTDLDWNSFSPVDASHEYEVYLNANNGSLEVRFDNILLPDSTTNELGSQGFFSYTIQPNSDLAEQTLIDNTAAIIFDSNPAIITNTVQSNMVSELPVTTPTEEVIKKQATFLFAPNPHQRNITLTMKNLDMDIRLTIYDILGKVVYTTNISNNTPQLSIHTLDWRAGTYFYQITEERGFELLDKGKLIKQ